jgi:hypothetical protein
VRSQAWVGFGVRGALCRVWGVGLGVKDLWFVVWGFGFGVWVRDSHLWDAAGGSGIAERLGT